MQSYSDTVLRVTGECLRFYRPTKTDNFDEFKKDLRISVIGYVRKLCPADQQSIIEESAHIAGLPSMEDYLTWTKGNVKLQHQFFAQTVILWVMWQIVSGQKLTITSSAQQRHLFSKALRVATVQ